MQQFSDLINETHEDNFEQFAKNYHALLTNIKKDMMAVHFNDQQFGNDQELSFLVCLRQALLRGH